MGFQMTRKFVFRQPTALAVLVTLLWTPVFASRKQPSPKQRIFAQKLIESALSKHPEVSGVELAIQSSIGCSTIAATNPKDIGEKCDRDELGPLRTGEPLVEKESDAFDITMPLHDTTGKIIGTVGMDFKSEPGQQRSTVVDQARKITQELEGQISSTEKLTELVP